MSFKKDPNRVIRLVSLEKSTAEAISIMAQKSQRSWQKQVQHLLYLAAKSSSATSSDPKQKSAK